MLNGIVVQEVKDLEIKLMEDTLKLRSELIEIIKKLSEMPL